MRIVLIYNGLCEVTYAGVMASYTKGTGRLGRLSTASPKGLYMYRVNYC
jgi:hypothetical protein